MAQRDLQFTPGTLIVAKGATVAFPNLDRVRHSIYSFSRIARFEIDLYGRDQTRTQRFDIAGTAALGCNIHDGMRGYVRVVDTPFAAKTDGNGIVEFPGVPGGKATVTIWHPRLRAPNNETRADASLRGGLSRKFKVLLVVALSWRVAKTMTAPLLKLDEATRLISAGERVEVPVETDDEIGRLAGSFNAMIEAIDEREKRIVHVGLHDGLTNLPNRKLFTEQLTLALARRGEDAKVMVV